MILIRGWGLYIRVEGAGEIIASCMSHVCLRGFGGTSQQGNAVNFTIGNHLLVTLVGDRCTSSEALRRGYLALTRVFWGGGAL